MMRNVTSKKEHRRVDLGQFRRTKTAIITVNRRSTAHDDWKNITDIAVVRSGNIL